MDIKYHAFNKLEKITNLSEEEHSQLKKVTQKFPFRANSYYLSFIDWKDPNDPIRRIIIPDIQELEEWGSLDASCENLYTVLPGLQHKYSSTALLLVSQGCSCICRYCFRKRIFTKDELGVLKDINAAMNYIRDHKEITNVLITGGDPLTLSTSKIENIIDKLMDIDHLQIIRIGSRMPAVYPYRIIEDPSFIEMLKKYQQGSKTIYIITHFCHPRELNDVALQALDLLKERGVVLANQTPLLRGINDTPTVLAELLSTLANVGIPPYYVFQCRPALGNKTYAVPIEEGYEIFQEAQGLVSGLAKRARFVLSHQTGKVEIVGTTAEHIYLKYHRAANEEESGRFMVFKRNESAYWLDDYDEMRQGLPLQ